MVFERVKQFFQNLFGEAQSFTVDTGFVRITVWMPIFVTQVQGNTELMEEIEEDMLSLAKKIEAANSRAGG